MMGALRTEQDVLFILIASLFDWRCFLTGWLTMRLVVDLHTQYQAEHVCRTARDGQRILNEKPINTLLLGHRLLGRGTGLDVLKWARQRNRLPARVTLVANEPDQRKQMADFLKKSGYAGDGIFYQKLSG